MRRAQPGRIGQPGLEAALLQNLIGRDPADSGRLRRDLADRMRLQPVGQPVQLARRRAERLRRLLALPAAGKADVLGDIGAGAVRIDRRNPGFACSAHAAISSSAAQQMRCAERSHPCRTSLCSGVARRRQ